MNTSAQIQEIFNRHHGIVDAGTLLEEGVNYYQLNQLVDSGAVLKLKRGLYKWSDADTDEMVDVARIVQEGVFCLHSAALFHELSTFIPVEYHVAIPDKSKVVLPEYPPIKLYYWDPVPYEIGIEVVTITGAPVQLYSPEKTVCDMVRFRQRVGMDSMKEVLKTYLDKPDRNLSLLLQTAKTLGVEGLMRSYLEILV
ncbi:MAG: type IV toxin-antitoxin system AbiEi family antitoxin domain-containing protein [Lewinellaceae bacterium]|nr:type IV toxin-antitoxin system AbiEi family antitoxin domain-containing protein [Lewinellaceae bacterium]